MNFTILLENDRLLNLIELINFCQQHQGQHIKLSVLNEGHCLTYNKVYHILDQYQFESVKIITFNLLEQHNTYQICNSSWRYWLSNIQTFDVDIDYSWNQTKLFGCFYGRPSAPRLGIAGHLAKNYSTQSLIATKFNFNNEDSRQQFDLERLFVWHPESVSSVLLLNSAEFASTHEYKQGHYSYDNKLSEQYQNILIDIICEPVCEGNSFYPTEKLARAVLCRRPFIVIGSKYYLHYLRQIGFKTFGQWWDESYDCYSSANRYKQVLSLIDAIAQLKNNTLVDYYNQMHHCLEHNYNLLQTQTYAESIVQIKDEYEVE